ncbi:MAG: DUF1016 domain-containing protein [Pyrinomonadaceae bacterium]|nr:DUF1016 domain-containing protein [Pyrinomonadaceae bacterium]
MKTTKRKSKPLPPARTGAASEAYQNIAAILETARVNAYRAVNEVMVQAYWEIGRVIVEEEQRGKKRADYGKTLIAELAQRLTADFGKGFTETNLKYMRQFYLTFPIGHALSDESSMLAAARDESSIRNALRSELSWTHYRLLLRIEKEEARSFYLNEAVNSRWSTRELERQINSLLYERLALSKDKWKVLELANEGQLVRTPQDLIKDPFVLEFLNVTEPHTLREKDLEQGLIDHLQTFLLELGRGFAFIGRQKRITIDGDHFYVDLVFYNYLLKCFVLIDLKIGKLTHQDIGQMDFYVRYFEQEEKATDDNPTIGLILCSDKNEAIVKYTLLQESRQIFASRYKLYLPTEAELQRELHDERAKIEFGKRLQ